MGIVGSGSSHQAGRFRNKDKYNPLERHRDKDGGPTCQKCLQKDHWTFQCKNDAVYQKRPTRTKQMLDPKKRKFMSSSEVPEEFRERSKVVEGDEKKYQKTSRPDTSEESKSQSYTTSYTSSKSSYRSSSSLSGSSSYTSSSSSYTSSSSYSGSSSESDSDFERKEGEMLRK
eukprot:jgi/Picsp_1/5154/NSC_02517-R1_protein